jgi:hypothetical protein
VGWRFTGLIAPMIFKRLLPVLARAVLYDFFPSVASSNHFHYYVPGEQDQQKAISHLYNIELPQISP